MADAAARRRVLSAVAPWLARVDIPDGVTSAVVGCSGGADSTALLALAVARGVHVHAVHVDHSLREGSAGEAEMVARLASRLGAACSARSAPVEEGPNLEARARAARLAVLEDERSRLGADAVLLGHTRDDQAETVLLSVLRGGATAGAAGIRPVRGAVVHPILGIARSETAEICARLGVAPLEDPMNSDPAFRRVWLRREGIPLLERGARRDLRAVLARQAEIMASEDDLLDELARHELDALGADPGHDRLPVAVARLRPALARRTVRLWLTAEYGSPPALASVDAALAVARGVEPAVVVAGGVRIERRGDHLVRRAVGSERDRIDFVPAEVDVPGEVSVCGLHVESWVERAPPCRWPDGRWTCVLDADRVGERVVVRPSLPGDRLRPLGMAGAKRVATVLAEGGVPPANRSGHPVLADATGAILWVVGYRVGAPARVTPSTRRWLWVQAEPTSSVGAQPA